MFKVNMTVNGSVLGMWFIFDDFISDSELSLVIMGKIRLFTSYKL